MRLILRKTRQLQRLAVFEAVGRLGSFTAAAAELGMTQPGVSKQMRNLEGSLRVALFDRRTNRRSLTDDGTLLYAALSEAFDLLEARLGLLRGAADRLRIAVQPSVAESWFVPHLVGLREAIAPAQVELVIFDHDRELDDLDHDVSIRFGTGRVPHLRAEKLIGEVVVPVASAQLAARLGLTPQSPPRALVDAPLLHVDQTGRSWQDWPAWFAANGIDYAVPEGQLVYPAYGSIVPLAISGRGVILSWSSLIGDHLQRGLLVEVGPPVVNDALGYFLHWPPSLDGSPALRRFDAWLHETIPSAAS